MTCLKKLTTTHCTVAIGGGGVVVHVAAVGHNKKIIAEHTQVWNFLSNATVEE